MSAPKRLTAKIANALDVLASDLKGSDSITFAVMSEAAERLRELDRENAGLQIQIELEATCNAEELRQVKAENAELRQQNEIFRSAQKACEDCDASTMADVQALRADRSRLDWLEGQVHRGFYNHSTGRTELSEFSCHEVKTNGIRAAIDAARKRYP